MLGRLVAERLEAEPPRDVWSEEVQELCRSCDALVLNLECCVSERGRRTGLIRGKPFFFRAPPNAVEALLAVRCRVAGLANNHALDFGPEALVDTLELLARAGIAAPGAGPDDEQARRGVVVDAGGTRIGVVALSDHPEEYAAGRSAPGIAYARLGRGLPGWVADELARLREEAEVVLAFPHWGPNMTVRPAAWQRERAHELVAVGADVVAGHSAHVFHGVERHEGRLVLYDLGDALDDYAVDRDLRNDLGVLALWRPGAEPELELIGLRLEFCFTELASGRDADWIAGRLERACGELGTRVERRDEARFALLG